MSTPHLYTDERVTLPSTEESPDPILTNRMREILNEYADSDTQKSRSNTTDLDQTISTQHDYQLNPKSNPKTTPWGNIIVFTPTEDATSVSHIQVSNNCKAVGYSILNDPSDFDPIKVFQPSFRRYFHFNTPHSNSAHTDIFIIDYITDPATERHGIALAGSTTTLKTINTTITFDSFRPQHGHAYLPDDTELRTIKRILDDHQLNYGVYENHTDRLPRYESFPSSEHNMVITQYSRENWTAQSTLHKYNPGKQNACCGSISRHNEDACILTEETAQNIYATQHCGHTSCKFTQ